MDAPAPARLLGRSFSTVDKHVGKKSTLEGSPRALFLRVGVSSTRGRRTTQEDAHAALLRSDEHKGMKKVLSLASLHAEDEHETSNEVEHVTTDSPGPGMDFVGVFDGHGGPKAADYCAQTIPRLLREERERFTSDSAVALARAFERAEEEFLKIAHKEQLMDGTTACVVVVQGNLLIHANVGDSEAVLCRRAPENRLEACPISEIHNPQKNDQELERIKMSGGRVYAKRLCHPVLAPQFCSIAVSRSIGDLLFKHEDFTHSKKSALIGVPYVRERRLDDDDLFLIVACDGLWDVFKYHEAAALAFKVLRETNSPQIAAETLVHAAYARMSTDNITCQVLTLKESYESCNLTVDEPKISVAAGSIENLIVDEFDGEQGPVEIGIMRGLTI